MCGHCEAAVKKALEAIEAVEEAEPPIEWRDQMPEEMKRPMMLLVRARKNK